MHSTAISFAFVTPPAFSAFKRWLSSFEEESAARYVMNAGRLSPGCTAYYNCYRSGQYKPKTGACRKRRLKSQGSRKLGFVCPAAVRAFVSEDGRVRALVFPHHCGHGAERAAEIPHLPLPRATKAYAQGETMPRSAAGPAKDVQSAGGRWRMAGGYIQSTDPLYGKSVVRSV